MIQHIWSSLKKLLIILILLWGALAVLARLATPLLDDARRPIEHWLSEQLNQPVQIGRLQSSWYGVAPKLRLHDVNIGQSPQNLQLDELAIDFHPAGLLSGNPLDAVRLTLNGLQLHLIREVDGAIHVAGIVGGNQGSKPTLPLPARLRLRNTQVHWQDKRAGNIALTLDRFDLDLWRKDDQLTLRASLAKAQGSLRIAADIHGYLGTTHWSGNSYVQADRLALNTWLKPYLPSHYQLRDGKLGLRLWQRWEQAKPVHNQGSLQLNDLAIAGTGEPVKLKQLRGDFFFDRQDADHWQLQIDKLQLQREAAPWPAARIVVERQLDENGQPWLRAAADRLELLELAQLLSIRPPTGSEQALHALQPRGQLSNLQLAWPLNNHDQWQIAADFSGLQVAPWGEAPGLSSLTGTLALDAKQASLKLDSQQLSMHSPSLFRQPLQINQLQGQLHWQHQGQNWQLQSSPITLSTPHLQATLSLKLHKQAKQPLNLQMLAQLRDADVAAVSQYLPASIMGEELVEWLDHSLTAGRIEQADAVIAGPLDDFPFDKRRSGAFEVNAEVRNTPLDYQAGWPALKDVDAQLAFHENSLDILLRRGRLYDSRIVKARASIHSLDPTSSLLMQGELEGPLKDEIRLLGEDALKDDFGHVAQALQVQGKARLQLDFEVPLVSGRGDYQLDGKLHFVNAKLALTDWDLQIDKINGTLGIGLDALRASGIRGQALGSELSADVSKLASGATRISVHTRLNDKVIAERLPQLPLKRAKGSADFTLAVDIPGVAAPVDSPTWLQVDSQLQGIVIDLPQPLGKSAEQKRKLQVRLRVAGKPQPLHIQYDQLQALLSPDYHNADIRYAQGPAQLDGVKGYQLAASVDRLDPTEWLALSDMLGDQSASSAAWRAQLRANTLVLGGLEIPQVQLALSAEADHIQGGLLGPKLAGQFRYPLDDGPILVNLDKAHLDLPDNDDEFTPIPQAAGPDPRQLPGLQVHCKDLRVNSRALGQLQILARRSPQGLQFERIALSGGAATLNASGSWQQAANDTPRSTLHGSISSPDLGELLVALGYPRQFEDAPANSDFALDWPGHPGQLHRASLEGSVLLDIGAGRLSELDPGITRVLGLLSLDAIGRRVKLNFTDLVKEGYSFDQIQGHFRVEEGNAYTNDLRIDGPSGQIDVGGRIGLVDRDFDQLVSVTPKLDATLPIGATLAGGPVAGVATLLAQQVLSDEVDRINRFEYQVSGSWDDPKLTQLDSGGALSKLVNAVTGTKTESRAEDKTEWTRRSDREASKSPLGKLLDILPKTAPDEDEQLPELH